MARSTVGRMLGQVAGVVLATAVLFGVVELALMAAGFEPPGDATPSFGFSERLKVFVKDGDRFRVRPGHRGRTFNDVAFAAEKPPASTRIFVLGGSSAYGFPWSEREAFSGLLQVALARSGARVEVINVGGLSYALHRVRILARELVRYEPDVFVIYAGHNEFVERAFFGGVRDRSEAMHRVYGWAAHTRLFSAALSLVRDEAPERGIGVDRSTNRRVSARDKAEVIAGFRRSLEAVLEIARTRGVRVVLCTVPANLADWRPKASLSDTTAPEAWRRQYERGRRALEAGDLAHARRALEAARELNPAHAETAYWLGQVCRRAADYPCAQEALSAAVDLDAAPDRRLSVFNDIIRGLGGAGVRVVDADRAFVDIAEGGMVGFDLIEDYVHPTLWGHREIGWMVYETLVSAGWVDGAAKMTKDEYDELVAPIHADRDARSAQWHFNQGVVLENAGHPDRARRAYERAVQMSPNYFAAYGNLALLHYHAGDRATAARYLARLQAIRPDDVSGLVLEANLAMDDGRFDDAIAAARRAARLEPSRSVPRLMWASALRAKGQPSAALPHAKRAAELDPNRVKARLLHAVVLMELGRFGEAEAEARSASRIDASAADAPFVLGLVHENRGRAEAAAAAYRRALALRPDHAEARAGLARVRAGVR